MLRQRRILKLAAAALMAAAIGPAVAAGAPANNLPDVAAGGGTAITPQQFRAAEQQTVRGMYVAAPPQWPLHPQALGPPRQAVSASSGGDSVFVAGLGGLALVSAGGLGIVYRDRTRRAV